MTKPRRTRSTSKPRRRASTKRRASNVGAPGYPASATPDTSPRPAPPDQWSRTVWPHITATPTGYAWPAELVAWALTLTSADIPPRLSHRPGHTILDVDKYLRWLAVAIEQGPAGPVARTGALESELIALQAALTRGKPAPDCRSLPEPLLS
jgi:hypothetical protein